jgi:sphinganine-1-phosphate aldolase
MSGLIESLKSQVNSLFKGKEAWQVCRDTVLIMALTYYGKGFIDVVRRKGLKNAILGFAIAMASKVPGANSIVEKQKDDARLDMEKSLIPAYVRDEITYSELPSDGLDQRKIIEMCQRWSKKEKELWGGGKCSGAVYHGQEQLVEFMVKVYGLFALSNPLHPDLFPYVRKMESEVIRMTASLFNGNEEVCGAMTSGGTESILMAIKTYRDKAFEERGISEPELICCKTAHAAFDKACAYFKIKLVHVECDPVTMQINLKQVEANINSNTICLVGSAPQFPHGIVDDITALGKLAVKHNIGLHVDCCLGSFCIPFMTELGYDCPPFDFRGEY